MNARRHWQMQWCCTWFPNPSHPLWSYLPLSYEPGTCNRAVLCKFGLVLRRVQGSFSQPVLKRKMGCDQCSKGSMRKKHLENFILGRITTNKQTYNNGFQVVSIWQRISHTVTDRDEGLHRVIKYVARHSGYYRHFWRSQALDPRWGKVVPIHLGACYEHGAEMWEMRRWRTRGIRISSRGIIRSLGEYNRKTTTDRNSQFRWQAAGRRTYSFRWKSMWLRNTL